MTKLGHGFLFLTIFLLISAAPQLYLFRLLKSYLKERFDDSRLKKLSFVLGGFFIVMQLPAAWRTFFGSALIYPNVEFIRGFSTAASIWTMGSIGSAAVLLVYNLFRRFYPLSGSPVAPTPDPARREFLKTGVGMAAAAPFMVSGYGALLERHRFEVDHFAIPVRGLSSQLSNLTVVHLTDIHVGPFMPAEELLEYVEAVNRLAPDLIALTGDFVTSSESEVDPCVESLAGLKARYGVFACIGNHDIFSRSADKLEQLFAEQGILTLRNKAVAVPIASANLSVLGIDDIRWGRPDLARALSDCAKDPGEVKILLSHRPEIFPEAATADIDLVLSGHYHGGQVKLGTSARSLSVARLMTPYAEGLFRLARPGHGAAKSAHLFVSRGVGITGLPIRVNCPPQIAHLRLIKA